ncbi:M48 family metallopeptidase [Rhodanobacter sp. DHB23]|uniref:M48 family metallopeptidase n=1 Tax=Rhodanobacter sp. DHB23 TaxID=2775923 RepID=UPI00177D7CEB|nr:M48 family metallopeptidase [Rhodanobacter sp. DHB23]MBD8873813.1 M48 family metallopeptidase [Rhodanobacter sp. DHB23]
MDFFARQAKVRSSTRILVLLFALAVVAVVAAMDLSVFVLFGHPWLRANDLAAYQHRLMAWTTLAVLALIFGCAFYRIRSLAEGGCAVAEEVGGIPVPPDVASPQLMQLRNVVEEVAIASGMPVPDIYLMPNEPGINAFAAGYSASDAAMCVTQGCLDHLTRDELQGVIAHEFSHVLNGDMRLNIRLMGLLFGIMAISVIGRQFAWTSGYGDPESEAEKKVVGYLFGMGFIVIGSIGYFFGRIIQAAVARSRESLADASAVQFTRQTSGIAGALKKIAVTPWGSLLRAGNRHEVAHMMFGDVDAFNSWFSTHPPLMQRIRLLEPWFREQQLLELERATVRGGAGQGNAHTASENGVRPKKDLPPLEWPGGADTATAMAATAAVATAGATQAASTPDVATPDVALHESVQHAIAVRDSMPSSLMAATRQAETALTLALALAISEHEELRSRQRRLIADAFGDDVLAATEKLVADESTLSAVQRMPLIALALPALKQLPSGRLETLRETLDAIVGIDPQVELDDYCLVRLLRVYLREAAKPRGTPSAGQKKLPACAKSLSLACAVVAVYGSHDEALARRAWLVAMNQAFPGTAFQWQALPLEWQPRLDQALDDLDGLLPAAKEIVIQSLQGAIQADGVVTPTEQELLRVICASLHCPVPLQASAA